MEFVAPMEDKSAFLQLGNWMEEQKEAFKAAKASSKNLESFINNGPIGKILAQARQDLDDDFLRLGQLKDKITVLHR
jgi:hypothetical protein